jgi:hypothetical protein
MIGSMGYRLSLTFPLLKYPGCIKEDWFESNRILQEFQEPLTPERFPVTVYGFI